MDFCKLNGKFRFATEIINGKSINYKIKKEYKIASSNGELKCPDCGESLIFKARNIEIKAPHFSHKSKTSCKFGDDIEGDWERYGESLRHLKVKEIFTKYFREHYKDALIAQEFQLGNGERIADVYIRFENDMEMAIEYQHSEISYDDWAEREDFYNRNNIKSLWVIDSYLIEHVEYKNTNFIGQILANEKNRVILGIDPLKEDLIIAKLVSIQDEDGELKEWFYKERYKLKSLLIKETGSIANTYFTKSYNLYVSKELAKIERLKANKEPRPRNEWNPKLYTSSYEGKEYAYKSIYKEPSKTNFYFNQVIGAIKGNLKAKDIIIEFIGSKASFNDFKIIENIFEYFAIKSKSKGFSMYANARTVYLDVMNDLGNTVREFKRENVLEFKCPYCQNKLERDKNQYGYFIRCADKDSCQFSFKC